MKLHLFILLSILAITNLLADSALPYEAKELLFKRDVAVAKIEADFERELEKLKTKYTKRGDLKSAIAIAKLIKKMKPVDEKFKSSVINIKWNWRHKKDKSSWFTLKDNNKGVVSWNKGQHVTWEITGRQEISVVFPEKNGDVATLKWNKDLNAYEGIVVNVEKERVLKVWGGKK